MLPTAIQHRHDPSLALPLLLKLQPCPLEIPAPQRLTLHSSGGVSRSPVSGVTHLSLCGLNH